MGHTYDGQRCSCGFAYFTLPTWEYMTRVLDDAGIPHHAVDSPTGAEIVAAPDWCYRLRCGLELYRVPEREWPGYFRAVHEGELAIDDLAVLFALAEDA